VLVALPRPLNLYRTQSLSLLRTNNSDPKNKRMAGDKGMKKHTQFN